MPLLRRDRRARAGFEAGPGCGARGRWQRLAAAPVGGGEAWPDNESTRRAHISDPAPPVWRAPEGPEGTGGLRGAAPNEVRTPSLAGGRALRRPEHQRNHKHRHRHNKAGRNLSVPARPQCPVVISSARRASVVHDHRVAHVGPVVDELRGVDGHVHAAVGAAVATPAEG